MTLTPKRILAVKLADLGDALLIVPALRALKKAYPQARLDVLTTENGRVGLEGLPYIDHLQTFDKYQYDTPGSALRPERLLTVSRFLAKLRWQGYDTIIFFHHFSMGWGALKFRGLALASGAKQRVGLDPGSRRAGFLNIRVADGGFGANGQTERDYWRKLVQTLTGPVEYDERLEIFISQAERDQARQRLTQLQSLEPQRPLVAFGPGSGSYTLTRRWPAIRYARLADQLIAEYGAKIILLGSKNELALTQQIQSLTNCPGDLLNLAGQTSPKEVVALLARCRLFVGNDGGLAQLAGVAGVPSVVIFGPTNHIAWAPAGTETGRVQIVQSEMDLPCRPCLYTGKSLGSRLGCAARPCLTTISPDQVLETIRQFDLS